VIVDNVAPTLTATHIITRTPFTPSLQVLAGELTDGSLTAGAEALQLSVVVEGPGGTYADPVIRKGSDWQYTLHPSVPGTYRLSVTAYDVAGNATTLGPFAVQITPWQRHYLPLVARTFIQAPDLVVANIDAGPQGVDVVIANRGRVPVRDAFWVDLYVNPTTEPFAVNETWNLMGTQGAVWGVTKPIEPGEALTLTVGDAFYYTAYSHLERPLPAGADLYVHVDSAGDSAYGGVLESHEALESGYNNILETTVGPAAMTTYLSSQMSRLWDPRRLMLPPRP